VRNDEAKSNARGRLRRIEGQVQGLQRMIDNDAYCVDVLLQISAVQPMSEDVEAAYSAPWPVPESKAGILRFPDLVPISPDHPDTPAHLRVREALGRWEKPALVLFSDSDPIFSPRVAERIAAHIPGALEPEIVAGAGHFLQEDRGEQIGTRIRRFVEENA